MLAELFIKGYSGLVLKVLLKIKELLVLNQSNSVALSDYLDMDLESLLLELKSQAEAVLAS